MTDPDDRRDPIAAAFGGYRPAPKELHNPRPAADVAALAGQTVDLTHYSVDVNGVTQHHERVTVTRPITAESKGHSENDR
ncbi:hypothetical protein ABQF26_05345 [Mycolicibacterium elephantis]